MSSKYYRTTKAGFVTATPEPRQADHKREYAESMQANHQRNHPLGEQHHYCSIVLIVDSTGLPVHLVSRSKSLSLFLPFPGLMIQDSPDRLLLVQRLSPYIHVVRLIQRVVHCSRPLKSNRSASLLSLTGLIGYPHPIRPHDLEQISLLSVFACLLDGNSPLLCCRAVLTLGRVTSPCWRNAFDIRVSRCYRRHRVPCV